MKYLANIEVPHFQNIQILFITDEMIVNPGECGAEGDCTLSDHPLSVSPESLWQTFFKDNEVLLQIDKDVRYGREGSHHL